MVTAVSVPIGRELNTAPGGSKPPNPQPMVIFVHVRFRCCVRGRVSVCCNVREHVLGQVSIHFYVRVIVLDRVHDLVRCSVRVCGRVCACPWQCAIPLLFHASVGGCDHVHCRSRVHMAEFNRICDSACFRSCFHVSVIDRVCGRISVRIHIQCPWTFQCPCLCSCSCQWLCRSVPVLVAMSVSMVTDSDMSESMSVSEMVFVTVSLTLSSSVVIPVTFSVCVHDRERVIVQCPRSCVYILYGCVHAWPCQCLCQCQCAFLCSWPCQCPCAGGHGCQFLVPVFNVCAQVHVRDRLTVFRSVLNRWKIRWFLHWCSQCAQLRTYFFISCKQILVIFCFVF